MSFNVNTTSTPALEIDCSLTNPRWERRKESRPAEILAAALDLFVEKGFAATRLDEVAARAGVSKGTLYLYFSSKEEMFKAVVRETIVPLIKAFANELSQAKTTAEAELNMFFTQWWTKFGSTKASGICKVVIGESGNFPEMALFFNTEVIEPSHQLVSRIIQHGMDSGEFRAMSLQSAAHLVMAPLVMKAIWQHSFARCQVLDLLPAEELISAHRDNILRAFAAPFPLDSHINPTDHETPEKSPAQ